MWKGRRRLPIVLAAMALAVACTLILWRTSLWTTAKAQTTSALPSPTASSRPSSLTTDFAVSDPNPAQQRAGPPDQIAEKTAAAAAQNAAQVAAKLAAK